MRVTVVWATPHLQDVVTIELAPGATIAVGVAPARSIVVTLLSPSVIAIG